MSTDIDYDFTNLKSQLESLLEETRAVVPSCPHFFSADGLSSAQLANAMCCVAFALEHNIEARYRNSENVFYVCWLAPYPVRRKSKQKSTSERSRKSSSYVRAEELALSLLDEGREHRVQHTNCGFFLHFQKICKNWYLVEDDTWNCVSSSYSCGKTAWPPICFRSSFIAFYLRGELGQSPSEAKVKTKIASLIQENKGFERCPARKIQRVVSDLCGKSHNKVLEYDQRVEDFMQHLNTHKQYGVLLYSNGDLIVPGLNPGLVKQCSFQGNESIFQSQDLRLTYYWESLPEAAAKSFSVCGDGESKQGGGKYILMTFEAIPVAVNAFKFSFPVISLDACTIHCPRTRAVLMTATFLTTNGHLISMCYGTAPSETVDSWCFFLKNLRQVLHIFCSDVLEWNNIVIFSDRHNGIVAGVKKFFPEANHLYCVMHLLRNVYCRGFKEHFFWEAVEASSREDFDDAIRKLGPAKNVKKLSHIDPSQWVRYAIRERNCRRFGVVTSNWSESQNHAFKEIRDGSVLHVLHQAFCYTEQKLANSCHEALYMAQDHENRLTPYARTLFASNYTASDLSEITAQFGTLWAVKELGKTFNVELTFDPDGRLCGITCNCHRFFDELIPCQHIIRVFRKIDPDSVWRLQSFVGHIYDAERFIAAFSKQDVFFPNDISTFSLNLNVTLPPLNVKPGPVQKLRYASKNEHLRPGRSHHTSRAPYDPSRDAEEQVVLDISRDLSRQRSLGGEALSYMMSFASEGQQSEEGEGEEGEGARAEEGGKGQEHRQGQQGQGRGRSLGRGQEVRAGVGQGREVRAVGQGEQVGLEREQGRGLVVVHGQEARVGVEQEREVRAVGRGQELGVVIQGQGRGRRQEVRGGEGQEVGAGQERPQAVGAGQQQEGGGEGVNELNRIDEGRSIQASSITKIPASKMKIPGRKGNQLKRILLRRENNPDAPEPPPKRRRIYKKYVPLIQASYSAWNQLYFCEYCTTMKAEYLTENTKPSPLNPAVVPLIPLVPLDEVLEADIETPYLSRKSDCTTCHIVVAEDLVQQFLARVHAFTAIGLQAEAFGYSFGEKGAVKYIVILPQESTVDSVNSKRLKDRKDSPDDLSHIDVINAIQEREPRRLEKIIQRCWLLTHPRGSVFLNEDELLKLYEYTRKNKHFFAIVLSPKRNGLKALCLHLTRDGFNKIEKYKSTAIDKELDPKRFIADKMLLSKHTFYCQIPFIVTETKSTVFDYRGDEVLSQLTDFINSRKQDKTWV